MRVVFLTHNYPRDPADFAGAFLHPLATALQARGHDVVVIAPSDLGRGGSDLIDGVPVRRVRYAPPGNERFAYTGRMAEAARTPAGWLALVGLLRGFRAAVRQEAVGHRDTVVHAHWWFPAGLAAPPEFPTVVTLHGTDGRLLASGLGRMLARRALRPERVVTAVSRSVAQAAATATGRALGAIPIQPMPVRVGESRISAGGGGLVVVARLTEQKRIHLAIEAHHRLRETRPGLRLTIIGDGVERPRLEALARRLGTIDAIAWRGQLPPSAVAAAIGDSDVAILPALNEGLGLTAVEALAVGVPVVVCRDGGGVLDILAEPGTGRVAEPDAGSIANAVVSLLETPSARPDAAAAGALWRRRLAPERVAAEAERWYEQVRRG